MKKIIIVLLILSVFAPARGRVRIGGKSGGEADVSGSALFIQDNAIQISLGKSEGYSYINKFGENPDIDTASDPEDIWDFGGLYTFSDTADINQLSSSSNEDTQSITVIGLDSNWNEVIQVATLTGQTNIYLATNLIRVYRMYNSGSNDFAGNIYLSVSNTAQTAGVPSVTTNVRAYIYDGLNQTLMAIYTVPAGKTALFKQAYVSLANTKTTAATISLRSRTFGGVFQVKGMVALNSVGNSSFQYAYTIPLAVPEKTDILIRCDDVTANDTAISAAFDIILIDN